MVPLMVSEAGSTRASCVSVFATDTHSWARPIPGASAKATSAAACEKSIRFFIGSPLRIHFRSARKCTPPRVGSAIDDDAVEGISAAPDRHCGLRWGGDMMRGLVLIFFQGRSEEHTSELQSQSNIVCRLLLE